MAKYAPASITKYAIAVAAALLVLSVVAMVLPRPPASNDGQIEDIQNTIAYLSSNVTLARNSVRGAIDDFNESAAAIQSNVESRVAQMERKLDSSTATWNFTAQSMSDLRTSIAGLGEGDLRNVLAELKRLNGELATLRMDLVSVNTTLSAYNERLLKIESVLKIK